MTTQYYPVPGRGETHYWVFETDAFGNEIPEVSSGVPEFVSPKILKEAANEDKPVTDVLVFIHGWQTDQSGNSAMWIFDTMFGGLLGENMPNSEYSYSKYIADNPSANFLSVGVHWPSAIAHGVADEKLLDEETLEESAERMRNFTKSLRRTDPITSDRIEKLIAVGLDGDDSEDEELDEEISESHARIIENRLKMSSTEANEVGEDELTASGAVRLYTETKFGKISRNVLRKTLRKAETAIFGQFEGRSRDCGFNGIHSILAALQEASPSSARFHVISHSLGAAAHCAALTGANNNNLLRKKVHTSVFLQGAIPSNSFANGQPFRAMADGLSPTAGATIVTTCEADKALAAYRVFHDIPLGLQGAINTLPMASEVINLGGEETSYALTRGTAYNVVADSFVDDHNNCFNAPVMNLIWSALSLDVPQEDLELPTNLSAEYFKERNIGKREGIPSKGWKQFFNFGS